MNNIETSVTLSVVPDPDYYYEVHVLPDVYTVEYHEAQSGKETAISFGSAEEMRAVASAMIVALGVLK